MIAAFTVRSFQNSSWGKSCQLPADSSPGCRSSQRELDSNSSEQKTGCCRREAEAAKDLHDSRKPVIDEEKPRPDVS